MTILPTLVIGGTPKSGTSSVYNWLAAHPAVTGSQPKEPFFLMDTDNPMLNPEHNVHRQGLAGYHHFFRGATTKVLLEATTHYLYQDTAREVLSGLPTPPLVVFILRKPSARIYSSFQYTLNNRAAFRRPLSFERYVDVLLSGQVSALDDYIEAPQSRYVLQRDLAYSTYVTYLEQWAHCLPADKLHVFLLEDIIRSPSAFMRRMCSLLSIDPSFYDTFSFPKQNETFAVRNQTLHKRATGWSALLPRGAVKERLKRAYLALQANQPPPREHHREALQKLDAYFEPYEQQLALMFNLDITAWARPSLPLSNLSKQ